MCKLKNILLNNYWVKEEIKEEIERFLEANRSEDINFQDIQNTMKTVQRRGVHSNVGLH